MRVEAQEQGVGVATAYAHQALAQQFAMLHRRKGQDAAAQRRKGHAREEVAQRVEQVLMGVELDTESLAQNHCNAQQKDGLPAVEGRMARTVGLDIGRNEVATMRPLPQLVGGEPGQLLYLACRNHAWSNSPSMVK